MAKATANDLKHEFMALMERAEAKAAGFDDRLGALEARLARIGIDAAVSAIEEELSAGTAPAMIITALARGFGIPLVAALVALTLPGKTERALDIVVPALADIARAFAAIQDQRAIEQQGRLPS